MLECGDNAPLGLESAPALGIQAGPAEQLDRDVLVERAIGTPGPVDGAHAANGQNLDQFKRAQPLATAVVQIEIGRIDARGVFEKAIAELFGVDQAQHPFQ